MIGREIPWFGLDGTRKPLTKSLESPEKCHSGWNPILTRFTVSPTPPAPTRSLPPLRQTVSRQATRCSTTDSHEYKRRRVEAAAAGGDILVVQSVLTRGHRTQSVRIKVRSPPLTNTCLVRKLIPLPSGILPLFFSLFFSGCISTHPRN